MPAIDDLYGARVATVDLAATVAGTGALLAAAASPAVASLGAGAGFSASPARILGGALVVAGALLFAGNTVATVVRHGGVRTLGGAGSGSAANSEASDASDR